MIKVGLIQRICPHYRVAVFRRLAEDIDLTLYYGKGQKVGANQNAKAIADFKNKYLFTIGFSLKWGIKNYYLSWFPFLLLHLFRDRPRVIITEGTTNIINNFFVIPYCRLTKTPVVWWDSGRNIRVPKSRLRKLFEPLVAYLIKQVDACITYGEIAQQYLISIGFPKERIFIAQNTIDISYVARDIQKYSAEVLKREREKLRLEDKKVILYVGAIERRKKIENLLISFKEIKTKYSQAALLIIGDGDYKDNIERFIKTRQIKDVYLLGRIVNKLGLYFLLCDILVLPGWNTLAINQAMAYGKPVITVPYGGPEYELVEEGKTGFIVERDNISQLFSAILKILNDDSLRKTMAINAQKRINNLANIDNMVKGIVKAVKEVTK